VNPSSRAVIVAGLAALVVVLLVVLHDAPHVPMQNPPLAPQASSTNLAVDRPLLPVPPTSTTAQAEQPAWVQTIAHVPMEQGASTQAVELGEVLTTPSESRGRLFTCRNGVDALPIAWQPAPAGAQQADALAQLLGQIGKTFAPYRLSLSCRAADLRAVPVQVYFDAQTLAALPFIGRDTDVTLQFLGTSPQGVLLARYIHVQARPVVASLSRDLPDLLAAMLAPEEFADQRVTCLSRGAAQMVLPAMVDAQSRSRLGADASPSFALLRCTDRRDIAVPILAAWPATRATDLLRVIDGTRLRLRLRGLAGNRLLATCEAIAAGGVEPAQDDLRLALLQPQAHEGRLFACTSLGIPLAQSIEPGEPTTAPHVAGKLANRKTWLTCELPSGPPLGLTVFFREGNQEQLLDIVRATRVELRLLGGTANGFHVLFERVLAAPTPPSARATDLRRFVLLDELLRGQHVTCKLEFEPRMVGEPGAPRPGARLFATKMAAAPLDVACSDPLRPYGGQRFEVYFADEATRKHANLQPGSVVTLAFAGVAENTPVAGFVAPQKL